ncbi:MAG: REG-2-like HAD superfamily hydrolase [Chlamydiales bacterium]|jgi:REG-2-like HAD superfamily hydrolase
MVLRHVFLDFGNTLVREVPSRFEIYAQAARGHGVKIHEDEMRTLMIRAHEALPSEIDGAWRYTDPWFRSYIRLIFGDELALAPDDWGAFQQQLFARFADPDTFQLFTGFEQLVDAIRAEGLGLGLISNWSPRLPGLLHSLGLEDVFDPVVCSAIERIEKPSPGIFHLALERAGVPAEACLHAGDHPDKDCRAARDVGLRTVLVDHADELGSDSGPHHRVTSLEQLKDHLLELAVR